MRNSGNIFYLCIPGAQSNEGSRILIAKTWMVEGKLLPHTVLLSLEYVNHLGELDSSKSFAENIDFGHFVLVNMDQYW